MFTIVTDTTSGLSRAEAADLGVGVLPMTYMCDQTRYLENFSGENGAYAKLFEASHTVETEAIRTSSCAAEFRSRVLKGNDVLFICLSSHLSGTYRSACQAAEALADSHRSTNVPVGKDAQLPSLEGLSDTVVSTSDGHHHVAVFDSWLTSGALELLVRHAVELARSGFSLKTVVEELERDRSCLAAAFTVPDIGALRRSGRLGAIRRSLSTKLDHYPIMQLEHGSIHEVSTVRGLSRAARSLVALAPDDADEFILSHYGERGREAAALLRAVRTRFPRATVRVKDGGPVLAKNLGLGTVSLVWRN